MVDSELAERRGMPAVIFDGDDTLWQTESLYDDARTRAAEYVGSLGLDAVEFESAQKRLDLERVATLGLRRSRFPGSSVEAVKELAEANGLHLTRRQLRKVDSISSSVFDQVASIAPDAAKVMEILRGTYQLALLTKGDESVQRKRLADSGLAHLLDYALIVEKKTERTFGYVLARLRANPSESWSVGNSLTSDIFPALHLGMRAVHVRANVWAHEATTGRHELDGSYAEADGLIDVSELIRSEATASTTRA